MPTNTNSTDDVAIDIDLSAIAAAADLAEEEDIEAINGARARQGTPFKCGGVVMACVAFGALIIGVSSFLLAGPPTTTMYSSSKQVAITSVEIEIDGFTKMGGGDCRDEEGKSYDYVEYYVDGAAEAQFCATKCSECPGGGQPDSNGVKKLLLRGFFFYPDVRVCDCYVENIAQFPGNLCGFGEGGAIELEQSRDGTGEIKQTSGGDGECWKVNSKSSKSPKSPKSPKRG